MPLRNWRKKIVNKERRRAKIDWKEKFIWEEKEFHLGKIIK